MEDGSAVAVEHILSQSGGLGFYQKRLFLCTCVLQALTASALIYSSHCRPDLLPPAPPPATNGGGGGVPHHPNCHVTTTTTKKPDPSSASSLTENFNVTGTTLPSNSSGAVGSDGGVVQGRGGGGSGVGGDGSDGDGGGGGGGGGGGDGDGRGRRRARDGGQGVTSASSRQHRHHAGKHDDHGLRGKTSVKASSSSSSSASSAGVTSSDFSSVLTSLDSSSMLTSSSSSSSSSSLGDAAVEGGMGGESAVHARSGFNPSGSSATTTPVRVTSQGARRDRGSGGGHASEHSGHKDHSDHSDHRDQSRTGKVRHDKRDDSLSRSGDDVTATADVSALGRAGSSTESSDVTPPSNDAVGDCPDTHHQAAADSPFYLTLAYLPAPQWKADASIEQLAQYNAYCQAVGAIIGAALGAMGADQVGRRKPLYIYFPLMLIAHCMSGFAVSWTMLAVFRFLVGVFAGACAVVSLVFPLEFMSGEWRDAVLCSGVWVVGGLLLSMEMLVTRHWRFLAFLSGGIGLPLVGTYFIVSESARWLLCHQKFSDAEQTLKEIVSCNSTAVPDFMALFDKSRACVVTTMHHKRYTYLDLFHSLEMTKWTVALVYTCLVGSAVYFCLLGKVKVMTGNVYLDNSLPFVIDLPLGWSAVVVNRCLGRRWCLFLYAVASGLALLSVLVLHMTGNLSHMPSMLTGMAVFGKIGVTASLSLVFVIAVEMYPTVVRCMGVAVGVAAISGGSMLADVFVFLEAYHYTVPFVVFGTMMASVGFAGLLFPETLHRPLPNILPCRHRTIPLHEGQRLVTNPWDAL